MPGSGPTLDLNADLGESFGRWSLGDDAALVPLISSANVACGFHAGDPGTMRRTVALAAEHGVAVGAHVGYPDLAGFGRRAMALSAAEVRDAVAYQVGALAAIAAGEGVRLTHVKPHGALYVSCSAVPEMADALARAVADVDDRLLVLLLDPAVAASVEAHGLRFVREAFIDLEYEADGTLRLEATKQAWAPERVAQRALRLACEGLIDAVDGRDLRIDAATACLHGDAPNAVATAREVRRVLEAAGVEIAPLRPADGARPGAPPPLAAT